MRVWSFGESGWREGESPAAAFTWFDLTGADGDALEGLAERFGLHPLAVEDCRSLALHAPKVDDFGSYLFVVLQSVMGGADGAETEELDAFLGFDFLITYQDKESTVRDAAGRTPAESVLAAVAAGIGVRPGPDGVLYELADRVVDDILPRVNGLAESLDRMQDELMDVKKVASRHTEVIAIRARAGRIRRVLTSQLSVVLRLSRGEFPQVSEANRVYFRDIYDHLVRIDLALEGVREDAEVALSTYLSAVNNRMSEVMKVLAVVSALMLPGTLISGIFGTNFDSVPGLHSTWGFVIMMAGMAGIALGMGWFFRRRGWF